MKLVNKIVLVSSLLLAVASSGASAEGTKTEVVNVAQNKPITSNAVRGTSYPLENFVDGDRTSFIVPEYAPDNDPSIKDSNEEIVIDLQRRYKVEKIEIFDRYNQPDEGGRRFFDIVGANNPDFSDGVVIGGMGKADDSIFPDNGPFTLNLDGENAYRYIKFKRTGGYYYGYSEIKVYAPQTATEVAGGQDAVADDFLDLGSWQFSPDKALNGANGNTVDCWLTENLKQYHFMRINFDKPYHIGMIEMEGRNFGSDQLNDNPATRKFIDLYGSNSFVDDSILISQEKMTEADGYKTLASVRDNNIIEKKQPFPPKYTKDNKVEMGMFQSTCDDTEAYKYLTFKKTYITAVAVGELRAYVINPVVNNVSVTGGEITVDFSDEMEESTISKDSVKVLVNNAEVDATVEMTDAYTAKITLPEVYFDSKINIEISKSVQNKKEVALSENKVVELETASAIDVNEFIIQDKMAEDGTEVKSLSGLTEVGAKLKIKNNLPDNERKVQMIAVLYDENNRAVKIVNNSETVLAGEEKTIFIGTELSEEVKEGYSFRVYVWKDFEFMHPVVFHKSI